MPDGQFVLLAVTEGRTTMKKKKKAQKSIKAAGITPYRSYKDRVFRMLYKDKARLLELYNALNNTSYANADDLSITTLENAIFIKMKNDVSFIIDCNMCLYEHQSTYCPNMPLRGLLYFADLYKKQIKGIDLSVSRQIKIPTPYYVVFYNGTDRNEEEFIQVLSDAFEGTNEDNKKGIGCIELTVRTLNINFGHNKELLEKCESLYGYAYFVAAVRKNLQCMDLSKAAEEAVNECIDKNILKQFFLEQKSEVIAMSIYEYNEEYVKKVLYEDGENAGYQKGESAGSCKMLVRLVESCMSERSLGLTAACEKIGVSESEYTSAKEFLSKNVPESES